MSHQIKTALIVCAKFLSMLQIKFILSFIVLINNGFTIQKIFEDKVFYNFVSYENELYVSSNSGIYKIDYDDSEYFKLKLFDKSISGPIKSDFTKDNNFKIKYIRDFNSKIFDKKSNKLLGISNKKIDKIIESLIWWIALLDLKENLY